MSDRFSLCRVALLSDGVAVQVNGRVSEASVEVVGRCAPGVARGLRFRRCGRMAVAIAKRCCSLRSGSERASADRYRLPFGGMSAYQKSI
jgi:hypothetical protein